MPGAVVGAPTGARAGAGARDGDKVRHRARPTRIFVTLIDDKKCYIIIKILNISFFRMFTVDFF